MHGLDHHIPCLLLERFARSIGDLLVGASQLIGIDVAATELLLNRVQTCSRLVFNDHVWSKKKKKKNRQRIVEKHTLVEVVFLATGATTGGAAPLLLVAFALTTELGSETGELVHDDCWLVG